MYSAKETDGFIFVGTIVWRYRIVLFEQYIFLKGNQLKGLIKLPFLLLEEFSSLASAVIRGTWAFWRSASIGTWCTLAGIILAEEVLGTFLALHPWALPYRIQVNWSWTLLTLHKYEKVWKSMNIC